MKTHRFANGDAMPLLGLGTWLSQPGEVSSAVQHAIRTGYRHIDCAAIYENEPEIGGALSAVINQGAVSRDALWITSKLWNNAHAAEDVRPALEKTLSDLRLEYLDLYLVHWPVALRRDVVFPRTAQEMVPLDRVPLAGTWAAMEAAVDAGLCRHIGVSNFSVAKLKALQEDARIPPEVNQIELHPYLQQPAMLDFCRTHGVHLTAYSPLGAPGRPAGLKAADEPMLLEDPAILAIAERHHATPGQVLIAWALHRETSVVPKSVHPPRIEQNLAAADLGLTDEDMAEMAALDRHRRYIDGTFWAIEGSGYTVATLWDE
jgi:alcohol dehydrogenase (NADP+)